MFVSGKPLGVGLLRSYDVVLKPNPTLVLKEDTVAMGSCLTAVHRVELRFCSGAFPTYPDTAIYAKIGTAAEEGCETNFTW